MSVFLALKKVDQTPGQLNPPIPDLIKYVKSKRHKVKLILAISTRFQLIFSLAQVKNKT